jgi:beta-lactamase class A
MDRHIQPEIADIEREAGGQAGVFAMDTHTGRHLGHRADQRFAMCSTFKLPLAAAVFARVDRGELSLDQSIAFSERDLVPYAPVAEKHLASGRISLGECCDAMVMLSDNVAANLVLRLIGGPAGFTRFMRTLGDAQTRLDRNEPGLNSNLPGDPRDTTTPRAMSNSLAALLSGPHLSQPSRERLIDLMRRCSTGLERIRAGLPAGWNAGDKTGTGSRGAANDIAAAWPPGRGPVVVCVYLSGSAQPVSKLNETHMKIARIVARTLGQG